MSEMTIEVGQRWELSRPGITTEVHTVAALFWSVVEFADGGGWALADSLLVGQGRGGCKWRLIADTPVQPKAVEPVPAKPVEVAKAPTCVVCHRPAVCLSGRCVPHELAREAALAEQQEMRDPRPAVSPPAPRVLPTWWATR